MTFEEKTLKEKRIYEGNITNYVVKEVALPNGQKAQREIVEHGDAVGILALTDDGKAVLVKQFRKAIERELYEIPAGLVEKEETLLEAAQRELEEETGYQANNWQKITGFYTSAGFSNEFMTIFLASDLHKLEQPRALDDDEFITLSEVTFQEMQTLHQEQEIPDAKTVVALLYWQILINTGD